jgi:hypothetical protein
MAIALRTLVATAIIALAATQGAIAHGAAPATSGPAPVVKNAPNASADKAAMDTDSVISDISAGDRTRPFPPGEKLLYFVNIKSGDKVRSPFRVAFVVSGMGIAPVSAGDIKETGHHHILIDMPLPVDIKAPIPFDKPGEFLHQHYKHFGGGETETVLDLPPGHHTLQLLFADHNHVPLYIRSKVVDIDVLPRAH